MDLTERFISELGGIVSGFVVEGNALFCAGGNGGIAANRAMKVDQDEQQEK